MVLPKQFLACVLADFYELVVDEADLAVQSGDADDGMLVDGEPELFHLEMALLQRLGHAVEASRQLADFSGQVPEAAARGVVAAAEPLYRRYQCTDRTPDQGISAKPGEGENDHRHDAQAAEGRGERKRVIPVGDRARDSHMDVERFAAFPQLQWRERKQPGRTVESLDLVHPCLLPVVAAVAVGHVGDLIACRLLSFLKTVQQLAVAIHDGHGGMLRQPAAADQVADAGKIVGKD